MYIWTHGDLCYYRHQYHAFAWCYSLDISVHSPKTFIMLNMAILEGDFWGKDKAMWTGFSQIRLVSLNKGPGTALRHRLWTRKWPSPDIESTSTLIVGLPDSRVMLHKFLWFYKLLCLWYFDRAWLNKTMAKPVSWWDWQSVGLIRHIPRHLQCWPLYGIKQETCSSGNCRVDILHSCQEAAEGVCQWVLQQVIFGHWVNIQKPTNDSYFFHCNIKYKGQKA